MGVLVQQVTERLRAQGGRVTAQRRLILETLDTVSTHPTAEELYEQARRHDPTLNLSTVYRLLRWLESEGLVSSRWFEGEPHRERFDPAQPADHDHFLCLTCKRVIEFNEPLTEAMKDRFTQKFGAQVMSATLVLYGQCADCRDTSRVAKQRKK